MIGIPVASTLGVFAIEDNGMGNASASFYMSFDKVLMLFYELYLIVFGEFFSVL